MFFDPSFLVVAQAADKAPTAQVDRQPDKKRAAPFNPKTGQGSKAENAPLPAPPEKTTAPQSVDETGSPKPVDPARLPSGMTDVPIQSLPDQAVDDEEPDKGSSRGRTQSRDRDSEREPAQNGTTDFSRSPWGGGFSGTR